MLLPRVSGGRCLENIVTTCEVGVKIIILIRKEYLREM